MLPLLTLTLCTLGVYCLITRSSALNEFTEDYVLALKARGYTRKEIIYKNVLRNALLPIVTDVGMRFGYLLSFIVLVEVVFAWNGIGGYMLTSVLTRDFPVLQGIFFIIAVVVVLGNFVADLLYGYLDPRIKVG